jgi:FkbM family methyltransferase
MNEAMPRSAPRIVYWDNMPAPYAVERYNTLAERGTLDFSVWFARRIDSERSWEVDESAWRFNGAYVEDPTESLDAAHQFARRCDTVRPDLVLALYGERPFAAGHLILKGLDIRTALLVLPSYDAWVRRAWWKERAKDVLFRSADAAKVPGPDGLAYACRYGFTEARVFPVRQSINVERYAASISRQERAQVRRQTGTDGCVFLYVGRFWAGKGLPVLLDAFRQVRKVNPAVSLLLVGDGPDEAALKAAAESIQGVRFQSFVQAPELPQYYAASDVFVFPTLGDPHGQVIEEAHAAGLPIIASDAAGDIRRRIADGTTGFVVRSGDVGALARRMIDLAADPDLRRSMGARGAERAKAWGHEVWADDFERFVSASLALPRRTTGAARATAAAGALAVTAGDVAARAQVWRKKAAAGALKTIHATIVSRANRLGLWLVSLPWRARRSKETLQRFGTKSGGWILPVDRLTPGGMCYCAGVGEETSLEDDLLRKTDCVVWSFDPTPQSAAHVAEQSFDPARFQFLPVGIGDKTETMRFFEHYDREMLPAYSAVNLWRTASFFEAPCTTVPALMRTFRHEALALLKLSVEGAEWRVLAHLLAGRIPDIRILCVVFTQPAPFWRVAATVRTLERHGFRYLCHDQWKFTFVSKCLRRAQN